MNKALTALHTIAAQTSDSRTSFEIERWIMEHTEELTQETVIHPGLGDCYTEQLKFFNKATLQAIAKDLVERVVDVYEEPYILPTRLDLALTDEEQLSPNRCGRRFIRKLAVLK